MKHLSCEKSAVGGKQPPIPKHKSERRGVKGGHKLKNFDPVARLLQEDPRRKKVGFLHHDV